MLINISKQFLIYQCSCLCYWFIEYNQIFISISTKFIKLYKSEYYIKDIDFGSICIFIKSHRELILISGKSRLLATSAAAGTKMEEDAAARA